MPNWCYNNLKVETADNWDSDTDKMDKEREKDKKELAKFKKENFNDNTLTFQKAAPMPEELNITSGSSTNQAIALINANNGDYKDIDKMLDYQWTAKDCGFTKNATLKTKRNKIIKYLKENTTVNEMKEGQQALDNLKKYGYKDWYNWRINNWGTKWDACEGGMRDSEWEVEATFDTAWAPPTPWLEKVSAKYKRLKFTLEYSEEGMGFEGKAFAKAGDIVDNSMQIDYPDEYWD